MRKDVEPQPEFGGLFETALPAPPPPPPAPVPRKIYSVSELTLSIRRLLERQLGRISVTGEVTNFRLQSSGHIYFTLKDASAQLSCVLFRGEAVSNRAVLQDGAKLVLAGELTVYEVRGQYQLRVTAIELQGVGALQQEFERLKLKLKAEGLFAPERKRPLPKYPQRIGIVTSSTGAALRDVLHVIRRRQPGLEIIMASCRVQGLGAGQEIACAIRLLNEFAQSPLGAKLDLILVTRGGGSLEDLWAFNEEVVARAIAASELPIVSAVGHEIDFTISDFVADFRAATPSAAAEIITEGVYSSCQFLSKAGRRLAILATDRLDAEKERLSQLGQRLLRAHPRRHIEERSQYLDDLTSGLFRCVRSQARNHLRNFVAIRQRLDRVRPSEILAERKAAFDEAKKRLFVLALQHMKNAQRRCNQAAERLRLLSPQAVLERGYSITMDAENGRVIRDSSEVKPGQPIITKLQQGELRSRVDQGGMSS